MQFHNILRIEGAYRHRLARPSIDPMGLGVIDLHEFDLADHTDFLPRHASSCFQKSMPFRALRSRFPWKHLTLITPGMRLGRKHCTFMSGIDWTISSTIC
jgi:hypothetical protein